MKKILLLFICLFAVIGCGFDNTNTLTKQELIDQHDNKLLRQVGENLIKDFPELTKKYSKKAVHQAVRENFELAKRHNIVLTGSIYLFTAYQLFLGKPVNKLDEDGLLQDILNSDEDEHVKIYRIKKRMIQLASKIDNRAIITGEQ